MPLLNGLGTAAGAALVVAVVLVVPGRLALGRILGRLPALEAVGLAPIIGWLAVAGVAHGLNIVPLEVLPFVQIPAWLPVLAAVGIEPSRSRRWVFDPQAVPAADGTLPLRGPGFARHD